MAQAKYIHTHGKRKQPSFFKVHSEVSIAIYFPHTGPLNLRKWLHLHRGAENLMDSMYTLYSRNLR